MVSYGDIRHALGDRVLDERGMPLSVREVSTLGAAERWSLVFAQGGADTSHLRDCLVLTDVRPDTDEVNFAWQGNSFLVVENPRLEFIRLVREFFPPDRPPPGVHPLAVVDPSSSVAAGASVGAGCYIGPDVLIARDTILFPNVTIYGPADIGAECRIHSGAVIGADGFGYERNEDGELEPFPHIGGVWIGRNVHVGANTCIDRGSLEDTIIERGARIDNLVHIAHNVHIGRDTAVIASSMIAGSVRVGDRAWIAPSAAVMNKRTVGDDATVGLGAVVVKDVPAGATVKGVPAK